MPILRTLRHLVEFILLLGVFLFFRVLPLDIASALGGLLGRMFGPFVKAHRIASGNLEAAMPELSLHERQRVLSDMWDNLGRVIGEYPHLTRPIMRRRITVEGLDHFEQIRYSEKGSIFVSGHFANWEIMPLAAALYGMPTVLIYRAANNPFVDWMIHTIRSRYSYALYKKGREGAHNAVKALLQDHPVGMLVDQKMNDGKPMTFFGRPAMTATAPATMAIKFQVPLVPLRIVRTDGAHFQVTLYPPIYYDKKEKAEAAMQQIQSLFEGWIRQNPAQWFWVHKRWG